MPASAADSTRDVPPAAAIRSRRFVNPFPVGSSLPVGNPHPSSLISSSIAPSVDAQGDADLVGACVFDGVRDRLFGREIE